MTPMKSYPYAVVNVFTRSPCPLIRVAVFPDAWSLTPRPKLYVLYFLVCH